MPVTTNLAGAVRHVKRHWERAFPDEDKASFRLWADALCINQNDPLERNAHLPKMGYIYSAAQAVLAWMGNEDKQVPLAFETIELLHTLLVPLVDQNQDISTSAWFSEEPSLYEIDNPEADLFRRNNRWSAVFDFFNLPYWERLWIFQEMALAGRLLYICPSRCIEYQLLHYVASTMFDIKSQPAGPLGIYHEISYGIGWYLLSRVAWAKDILRDHGRAALSSSACAQDLPTVTTFKDREYLVSAFAASLHATDPKDYIYGLLGLTQMDIDPDYGATKSVADVYCEYVAAWIRFRSPKADDSGFDELIFLPDAGVGFDHDTTGLPSWCPNYPHINTHPGISSKSSGLAGINVFTHVEGSRSRVTDHSLIVTGVSLQKVARVTWGNIGQPPYEGSLIEYMCNYIRCHQTNVTGISSFQALFLVLKKRRNPNKMTLKEAVGFLEFLLFNLGLTQGGSPCSFQNFAEILGCPAGVNFKHWILPTPFSNIEQQDDIPKDFPPGMTESTSSRVIHDYRGTMNTLVHYTLIETEDEYLGLAPKGTLPGDLMCVLKGCSIPVILRKSDDHYVFVGLCWVLGFMEGEAKQFLEDGRAKVETFELR